MSKSYVFIWYLIDLAKLGCRNTNGLQIAKYYDGKEFFGGKNLAVSATCQLVRF
jgi:hypothetical protein